MDILIKGLEMPKEGDTYGLHLVIYPNGEVWIAYDDKPITEAIEVKPHGRVVDIDAFFESEKGKRFLFVGKSGLTVIHDLYQRLANAPTVLEATNELKQ